MRYSDNVEELRRLINERIRVELDELKEALGEFKKAPIDKVVLYIGMKLALSMITSNPVLLAELRGKLIESLGLTDRTQVELSGAVELFTLDEKLYRRLGRTRFLTISSMLGEESSRREILTYIWMRKAGILKKRPNGSLVVDRDELSRYRAGSTYRLELNDIKRFLGEIPSRLWSKVLTEDLLNSVKTGDLVSLAEKFYGFNHSVDSRIIGELRRRIVEGWMPSFNDARRLEKVLGRALKGVKADIPPHLLQYMDNAAEYVKGKEKELVERIEELPLKERWGVLRGLRQRVRDADFYRHLNPLSLMELKSLGSLDKALASKIMLGEVIGSYVEYMLTRDASFKVYALYIAERIDPSMLEPMYRPVLESIIAGDEKKLLFHLGREIGFDLIELISIKLTEEYSRSGAIDQALVKRAIAIGMRLLNYMKGGEGHARRIEKTSLRGRLDTRGTVYKRIRLSNEIVYRRHRRRQCMIGVVDVSGSMARFALWSILSLAVLFPSVSYIVLFSERSNVYRSPVKKTARMLAGFLEKLYTEGFKGYTNISDALRKAGELALRSNSKTIVLFSDLKQTIPDVDPWIVAGELVKKGLKVIIVVPRSIEEETIEKYRKEGCDVVVVENPENIANILKRRINLKNRV